MNVGDRVKFIGPEYRYTDYLRIGQIGVIVRRDGQFMHMVGRDKEELVTVQFEGYDTDVVLSITRIALVES